MTNPPYTRFDNSSRLVGRLRYRKELAHQGEVAEFVAELRLVTLKLWTGVEELCCRGAR